jgi:formate hydrogenlyase subunit 6/NADH:ubiquinone oxidoreductase subunit I
MANKICAHACISCKRCEKACPAQAIAIPNNLAEIDYAKCVSCGKCVDVCPHKVLVNLREARREEWPDDARSVIEGETPTEGRSANY